MEDVTLDNVGGGAAPQLFERHLPEILANIQDLNTDAKKARKITLEVVFNPTPDREAATVVVRSKVSLAPTNPAAGMVHMGRRNGRLVAVTQDIRQGTLFEDGSPDPSVVPIERSAER